MTIPNKTILLVEDDEVMALTLSRYLEKQNFRVITESDGDNVLAAIDKHEHDDAGKHHVLQQSNRQIG